LGKDKITAYQQSKVDTESCTCPWDTTHISTAIGLDPFPDKAEGEFAFNAASSLSLKHVL